MTLNSEREESKEHLEQPPTHNGGRRIYSERSKEILIKWLKDHLEYPHPSLRQRAELCELTGLSRKQLKDWFFKEAKVNFHGLCF